MTLLNFSCVDKLVKCEFHSVVIMQQVEKHGLHMKKSTELYAVDINKHQCFYEASEHQQNWNLCPC